MEYSWMFVAYPMFLCSLFVASDENGCSETSFILCVTRIRLKRVPFDTNMLNVVFNVTTEAKLRQTCIAYGEALPCFRDRILQCGNDKQKRLLDEVAKIIKFFCSPSSTQIQQIFLKHGSCIGKVLQMPATTDCYMTSHPDGKKLEMCRQICYERKEFLCMMKIWVSEQSLCTLIDTERNCGQEAGEFYQKLQTNVFTDNFPIICDYSTLLMTTSTVPILTSVQASTVPVTVPSTTKAVTLSTTPFMSSNIMEMEFVEIPQKITANVTVKMLTTTKLPTSPSPSKNINFLNHTHSLERPDYQFNRIMEVTVVPPSTKQIFHPMTNFSKSGTVQNPDSNANYNYPVIVDTKPITTPTTTTMMSETQTFWRPWYLKGVGYNFDTSKKPTTISLPTTTIGPTTVDMVPKSISLNEIFSYDMFKKMRSNKEQLLDTKSIQSLTGNNDFGSRKNTHLTSFGWPFWNGSSTISKISCIVLTISVLFVKLF